ncbi:uncharacterized protein EDB91DRAFT_1085517 [Suillus paluster]|uniref:uncharacterized protein n=1 Tax=Suillus paluster TaxID=48578 RepID=UPI001B8681C1|nr:uncharacterized protein EDB91DRAFT_1085517 [Suillus paluster]KAG1730265.1 hypothetical protein EDB91DRAFT_1085517 [Suillus paluster]
MLKLCIMILFLLSIKFQRRLVTVIIWLFQILLIVVAKFLVQPGQVFILMVEKQMVDKEPKVSKHNKQTNKQTNFKTMVDYEPSSFLSLSSLPTLVEANSLPPHQYASQSIFNAVRDSCLQVEQQNKGQDESK